LVGLREHSHDDVTVGEDADGACLPVWPVLDDDQAPDVKLAHAPSRIE
jgi:hypothetical protein